MAERLGPAHPGDADERAPAAVRPGDVGRRLEPGDQPLVGVHRAGGHRGERAGVLELAGDEVAGHRREPVVGRRVVEEVGAAAAFADPLVGVHPAAVGGVERLGHEAAAQPVAGRGDPDRVAEQHHRVGGAEDRLEGEVDLVLPVGETSWWLPSTSTPCACTASTISSRIVRSGVAGLVEVAGAVARGGWCPPWSRRRSQELDLGGDVEVETEGAAEGSRRRAGGRRGCRPRRSRRRGSAGCTSPGRRRAHRRGPRARAGRCRGRGRGTCRPRGRGRSRPPTSRRTTRRARPRRRSDGRARSRSSAHRRGRRTWAAARSACPAPRARRARARLGRARLPRLRGLGTQLCDVSGC